jgi:hypothetical protein
MILIIDHSPLFPSELINERCVDNEEVFVELLGPKLCPNDPGNDTTISLIHSFACLILSYDMVLM